MSRAFAILVTVAASWSILCTAAALLLPYYSGGESLITMQGWIRIGVDIFVCAAAIAMAWHLARRRPANATTA